MILLIVLAINIFLWLLYKPKFSGEGMFVLFQGWTVFIHELFHYIPSLIYGWNPKFCWKGEHGAVAYVEHTSLWSEGWNPNRDYIVSCSTYILPWAMILAIPFVPWYIGLYLALCTPKVYLASHYDEKTHYQRVMRSVFFGH